MRIVRLSICVAWLWPAVMPAQQRADALAGRWELNVERSHYGGGATPRVREVFACAPRGVAVTCSIESERRDGQLITGGFTASYDGAPSPTHGMPDVDRVQLARVADDVVDATFFFHGAAVFAYRAIRSVNGRALTIIAVSPRSRAVLNSVIVYDRR